MAAFIEAACCAALRSAKDSKKTLIKSTFP